MLIPPVFTHATPATLTAWATWSTSCQSDTLHREQDVHVVPEMLVAIVFDRAMREADPMDGSGVNVACSRRNGV